MKHFFRTALLFLLCSGASAAHIGFLMPSGGRQGTSVEIIVGGQAFWSVNGAIVSGGGVTVDSVKVVPGIPNVSGSQQRYLTRWLTGIAKGNPAKPELPETTEGWRMHAWFERLNELDDCEKDILCRSLYVRQNSLQASPAINSRVLVKLTIAQDAAPGERELRLIGRGRVSNPLKFFVGKNPEVREPFYPMPSTKTVPPEFTVPAVLNGQIMPGEQDKFIFTAKKGEVITFSALARHLMPFIGDGVPGHFQMVLEIVDDKGKSLAYADDRYFDPDPELEFKVPADGKYTLLVRDALYRGRADFVYRISALPGKAGVRPLAPLKLFGIAGTVNTPAGENHTFKAKKGVPVMLEVYARRLGSPLDGLLKVTDSKGKVLAVNDDVPRLKAGTILHLAADPVIRFTPPEDGEYTANISDISGGYGKDYRYRLRIGKPVPHFAVYALPSAVEVGRYSTGVVTLAVERYDGFDGEIKLRLQNAGGFRIVGTDTIPPGCDRTAITLYYSGKDLKKPLQAALEASGGGFTTKVIPGDEMMQAFAYTHIAPAQTLFLTALWKNPGLSKFNWQGKPGTVKLDKDVTLTVNINTRNHPKDARAELMLIDPPSWLKVRPGKAHIAEPGKVKSVTGKAKMVPHPLKITLYAEKEGKGKAVNQLFKVRWQYNSKPDKNGKIRRITQEVILPARRIEGGK
ncbi:MAG: hypothetical protein IJZ19_09135 [Lentisphaeria bacterium]|nr:hypothetical protein [Lentisphaeria bacterium]MBQ9804880.1 hypothetical protein [Lentisphaeria bacterium]